MVQEDCNVKWQIKDFDFDYHDHLASKQVEIAIISSPSFQFFLFLPLGLSELSFIAAEEIKIDFWATDMLIW